jgi:alcohol dehydrogenase (cytochrome c)
MTDIRDRTDIEYREAPPAVDFGSLTTAVGTAPPVVQDVTYERILDARSEP